MIYLMIDMPVGRVMVRLGRVAESEFPAPMLRSRMCSTLVDVDVALGPGSVASVVRYGYWKKKKRGDHSCTTHSESCTHSEYGDSGGSALLSVSSACDLHTRCRVV